MIDQKLYLHSFSFDANDFSHKENKITNLGRAALKVRVLQLELEGSPSRHLAKLRNQALLPQICKNKVISIG